MKKLKLWNGPIYSGPYDRHSAYIAATSTAHAARLLSLAYYPDMKRDNLISPHEVKRYFSSGAWGNKMDGIEPTEPCVYVCASESSAHKPFRVI